MRASDLVGRAVVDDRGRRLGHVNDLRAVDDGAAGGRAHDVRIDALLVGVHHVGSSLGYTRDQQRGPWLVRTIVRALHRDVTVVPWDRVVSTGESVVVRAR